MTELNVGILALEVYFPGIYVDQAELEVANGVSKGKYTIGLGQEAMAFSGDREDINSISLTVVQSLLDKYQIDPKDIGRLEIGTETLIDKSKSTKTTLMSLFAASGNRDVEGATIVNACYGGTAALLNALTWVESNSWDGRYALVVAADIAVYAAGPARPTGGCGAVAILVGRDAPLPVDLKTRCTHAVDVWDFFKPKMDCEYPEVDGALSQTCYLRALDDCYTGLIQKNQKLYSKTLSTQNIDYFIFHAPYNKLVQKGFGRLLYLDMVSGALDSSSVQKWLNVPAEQTYEDKELETALKGLSSAGYKAKVDVSCKVSKQIGNTYTASLWMNLSCIVSALGNELVGKNLALYSYGSGALATLLSIYPRDNGHSKFNLQNIQRQLNVFERLASREKLSSVELNASLSSREELHGEAPMTPKFSVDKLLPGTFYLQEINAKYERIYARKPVDAPFVAGAPLF